MGTRQQQTGGSLSNVSIAKGIGVGISAWILTFVLTNLLFILEIGNSDAGFEPYDQEGWRDLVGVVFGENYFSAYPGAFDAPSGISGLLPSYDTVPDFVYILIVVGVLALLGYRMVANAKADFDEIGAAAQGATMAISYAVLMGLTVLAVGAFMEGESLYISSDIFSDKLTDIVLVAGVIYPVVFGGGGGAAAVLKEKQAAGNQPAGRPPAQGQPPAGGRQPGQPQGARQPGHGAQQPGQPQGARQPGHGAQQPGQPQGGQQPGQPQDGQPQGSQPRDGQPQGQPRDDRQPTTDEPASEDPDPSEEPNEADDSDSAETTSDTSGAEGTGGPSGAGGDS